MIRDCLESGSQKFGMCVPTGDEMSDIGKNFIVLANFCSLKS